MTAHTILALESGGTKLVASLTNLQGEVQDSIRQARPPHNQAADTLRQLIAMGQTLEARAVAAGSRLVALGFGFGGLVRRSAQEAYLCLHEDGWHAVNAHQVLAAAFGVPVFIENDCKVAALAEATFGAGRGAHSVFYATMGTGVGGGFVRGGEILALDDGGEAEIGHLCAEPDGPRCDCGGRGCVEALCSGPGMARLGQGRFQNAQQIFAAWTNGQDPGQYATQIVERCARHMAHALAAVMALLHPQRIVLGGGVASANPRYVDLIRELAQASVVSYFRADLDLRVAELGELVVSQGAALFARHQLQKRSDLCLPLSSESL